jgi:hypothetical protein
MADTKENKVEFNVNPNQKVYDVNNVLDHLIDVIDIYFAEQKKKYKWVAKEEVYVVKNSGTVANVLDLYKKKLKKAQKKYQNLQADPNHTKPLKAKDQIKITWEEQEDDGFELVPISKIKIGKKLFVVAKCAGDKAKLTIELLENKSTNATAIFDSAVKFLIGTDEKVKIEFNITQGKFEYQQEITLRPKADADLKKLIALFDKRDDKNAFLYLKGEVTETQDEIRFPNTEHEFKNKKDEWLEVIVRDVCSIDPANRSHFVIHNTAGAQAMGIGGVKTHVKFGTTQQARSKAHKYIMTDGTIFEVWPFTDRNVWATRTESSGRVYNGKNVHVPPGQMFHVELSYGTKEGAPSEAQYQALANLYIEASEVEGCWPVIVPHKLVDAGISGGHGDPENFDYTYFYEILKQKKVPIDHIPKYTGSAIGNTHTWPPIL